MPVLRKIRVLIADETRAQSLGLKQKLEDLGFIVDVENQFLIDKVEHEITFIYMGIAMINNLSDISVQTILPPAFQNPL